MVNWHWLIKELRDFYVCFLLCRQWYDKSEIMLDALKFSYKTQHYFNRKSVSHSKRGGVSV